MAGCIENNPFRVLGVYSNASAKDIAGKISYAQTVIQKDTQAPQVQVVVPCEDDVVNGENLIAFIVKDSGHFSRAEYVAPKNGNAASAPVELPLGPMVVTHIGTADKQISDLMSFNFYDETGNVETLRRWDFIIDQKSDLPIAEVLSFRQQSLCRPQDETKKPNTSLKGF